MKLKLLIAVVVLCASPFANADIRINIIGGGLVKDPVLAGATVGIEMGPNFGNGFCTGTYIGHNKVLTAAHCISRVTGNLAGTHVLFVLKDRSTASCNVTAAIKNPGFGGAGWWDDVGVLKIDCDKFDLSKVQAIALPKAKDSIDWDQTQIVGYGMDRLADAGCPYCTLPPPTFPTLKTVNLKTVSDFGADFEKNYPDFAKAMADGRLICFSASKDDSFYEGDSGGPSVTYAGAQSVVVGVHSVVLADNDGLPVGVCDVAVQPKLRWIDAQ